MKNKFLKLTLLIAFAVMLFAIPNDADAATYDIYTYTISGNEITITDCKTNASGAIIIPKEIEGKKVTSIGEWAFYGCTSLTSITIPESETSIGSSAFRGCTSLTSITIPESVTSIGNYAFEDCTSLTSITIPESVTSIGNHAFYDCTALTSITIPDSVTSIGDSAFWYCESITSITIPDSVTSIGDYAFSRCTSLASITIPESVTSIGYEAFYGCTSLTSITIPESVTSIEDYTFRGCTSLTSITIPESVTSIGSSAFSGCTSLTSITIPESVTSIGPLAFRDCDDLEGVYIIDVGAWCNIEFGGYYANPLYYARNLYLNENLVTQLEIPDSVSSISNNAFYRCSSLVSIKIPESVISIGECAFYGCKSLTSIKIPDSVTSIGGSAFDYCTSLTSITIPDSVTSIGRGAFEDCSSLEEITLPFIGAKRGITGTFDSVFGYIFGYSTSSESGTTRQYYSDSGSVYYYIPSTLKKVTITDETVIPHGAFYNCVNLTDVIIEGNPTAIMAAAFMGHENLWNITIKSKNVRYANGQMFNITDMPTIYGYEGSTTEAYAEKYEFWFVPIGGDEPLEKYTIDADASLVNGKIVIDITTNKPVTDQALHVALYNDATKLVDYIVVPLNKTYNSFNVVFKDEQNSSFAKVFLWDGLESMTPVAQAKTVTIKNK